MAEKIDVAALQQRLRGGKFTEEDLVLGERLMKGIESGDLSREDLLLPGETPENPAAPAKPAEPAEPVVKALEGEGEPGDEEESDEAGEGEAPTAVPDPDSLKKALEADPEARRALNAVPALQALVKSFEAMAEGVQEIARRQAEDQQVLKSLSSQVVRMETLQKSLATAPAAPAVPAAPAADVDPERVKAGEGLAQAITKALTDAGLAGLAEKVEQLDQAVNRRPHSGNPPRSREVRKSLAERPLGKTDAIGIVQKSLDLGKIRQTDAESALASLDVVDVARRQGQEVSYADVVRRVCGSEALEGYAG